MMDKKVVEGKQADAASKTAATAAAGRSAAQKNKTPASGVLKPLQQMEKQWRDSEKFFAGLFPAGWLQPFQAFMPEWPAFNPYELLAPQDWFAAFWGKPPQWGIPAWPFALQAPRMDLITRDDAYVIRADIPGVKQEDVEVSFSGNTITLKGKTAAEKDETSGAYHVRETLQGAFSRTMTLPGAIDSDKASTTLKDGSLEIAIPRGNYSALSPK